jgi:DNA transformation protein
MPAQTEFVQYVLELLEPLGGVTAKAMFGGFGIYRCGVMVALIADETLYLKADDINRPDFEAQKLEPFRYQKKDKMFAMSYYQAPPEAMDESELLCEWVEGAYSAAVRGAKKKATKPRAKKKKSNTLR